MNKARRKQIAALIAKLEEVAIDLEEFLGEEQGAFDELSERAQDGAKGEKLQEAIDALDSGHGSCQEAIEALQELAGS